MGAVVFDCDGVLVDSEPIAAAAWSDVLPRYGHTPTDADFSVTRGTSTADAAAYFGRFVDVPPGVNLRGEYHVRRDARFDTDLVSFPDAVEAVRALAAEGVPLGCASSSDGVELSAKLERFDLLRYFEVVVSADDVARVKPAPDLYLAAAAGLGVDPRTCLAIEDTDIGADAAVAAGMRAVIVARRPEASERHTMVSSIDADLILGWLGLA